MSVLPCANSLRSPLGTPTTQRQGRVLRMWNRTHERKPSLSAVSQPAKLSDYCAPSCTLYASSIECVYCAEANNSCNVG